MALMKRRPLFAVLGLILVVSISLGWVALSIGLRSGQLNETLLRFPPQGQYQLIVRIGSDGRHWGGDVSNHLAVNIWAHGSRTSWHVVRLVHIPLGERDAAE